MDLGKLKEVKSSTLGCHLNEMKEESGCTALETHNLLVQGDNLLWRGAHRQPHGW
jgi:hypothetical protein